MTTWDCDETFVERHALSLFVSIVAISGGVFFVQVVLPWLQALSAGLPR